MVLFVHRAATLDNWDPALIDPIAARHHMIAFDNRGVGASTGTVPDTIEAMTDDAFTFITAPAWTPSTSCPFPSAAWSLRPWCSNTRSASVS